jgi:fatty acid synthase
LVQVGLVDMLREEWGIAPAGVLGHSAGEIACGYADGGLSAAQCVLVAYHRGRAGPALGMAGGLMAAVGLGADEAQARLDAHGRASCVVACDNSPVSATLSGAAWACPPAAATFHASSQDSV